MKKNILGYVKGYGFKSVVVLRALKLFFILFLIAAILITVAYYGITSFMRKNMLNENDAEAKKAVILFDSVFREAEYLAAKSINNNDVKLFFSFSDTLPGRETENRLKSLFNSYNTGIKNLYLYNSKIDCIITSEGKKQRGQLEYSFWLDNLSEDFYEDYKIVFKKNKNDALQSVFFIKKDSEKNGFVAVELDIFTIKSKFKDFVKSGEQIYILIGDTMLYSNSSYEIPEWFTQMGKNQQGYLKKYNCVFSQQKSEYYDFRYVVSSSSENYLSGIRNMYFTFVLIFIAVIIVISVMSVHISADSLYYIADFMNILETKKMPDKLKDNEIKFISDRIVFLINDNEKLKNEVETKVINYNEMQSKALQKQIMPHFINNSLNALGKNLIDDCGYTSKSIKMLTKLTRIVKYSYISDNGFVSLGDELAFLEDYLSFLKYRYENFDYKIEYSPELKDFKVLKMILQPFCENAVFHGIKNSGVLTVKAEKNGSALRITVRDNGVGMDKDTVEKILKSADEETFEKEKIGIKNVLRRLKIIYGEAVFVDIKSEVDRFTEIIIEFPAIC